MKTITNKLAFTLFIMLFTGYASMSQTTNENEKTKNQTEMKTYVIEREIPGVGQFTPEQLRAVSQSSCTILKEMGPQIQWVHSYVTGNKLFCIYKAASEELIRQHAKKGGFPANVITEVSSIISPATAD